MAERMAYFPEAGLYIGGKCPPHYICTKCSATNCKLWRQYQTFADRIELLCATCAAADQKKDISGIDAEGRYPSEFGRTDQIGWYVPAVPTEEGDTYWGYTSVPQPGCDWWKKLPTLAPAMVPV